MFEVSFNLLKLTRPASVFFEILDLGGRPIRQAHDASPSGRVVRFWDGRDRAGVLVAPGLYLYRVRVEADAAKASRQGIVSVMY